VQHDRYLACLAADQARFRAVAPLALAAPVPTCPGWTVADLTRHLSEVYLHKAAAIREGEEPTEGWPPPQVATEHPLALLDHAYLVLTEQLAAHRPGDPAGSWYSDDQTVGFWARRMAQETVIHRIDAELGTGSPVAPVPADLAVDGVDELLRVFVAYSVRVWGQYFREVLDASPGHTCLVRTDAASWLVRSGPDSVMVEDGATSGAEPVDATLTGSPSDVLRRLWNRELPGRPSPVEVRGDPAAVEELRRLVVIATQ